MSPYVVPGMKKNYITVIQYRGIDFYKRLVADFFEIPIERLPHKTRKREIVKARQTAMYLITKYEDCSLKSIGEAFGGRDHTTVIHSRETVKDLMFSDNQFKEEVEFLERKLAYDHTIGTFKNAS